MFCLLLLLQPSNFPYKEEIMSVNPTCLVVIILLFISIILAFKVSPFVYILLLVICELSSLRVLAPKTHEELQASQYDSYKSKIRHYEKKKSRKTHRQTDEKKPQWGSMRESSWHMNPLKEWTKERLLKQTSWFFNRCLAEPLTKGFKKQTNIKKN